MFQKGIFFRFLAWLRYFFTAKTRFGIHSPFLFDLIEKVFLPRIPSPELASIRHIKATLLENSNSVEITDFGSGRGKRSYQHRFEQMSHIARKTAISRKRGELLYKLVAHFKPETIIEMGTSLGISTMYLAKGAPEAKIITLEGCSTKAGIAVKNFDKLHIENIQQQIGRFDLLLSDLLKENPKPDFVFIDGNHTCKATMRYFSQFMEYAHNNTVIVVDDIHHSKSMETAWRHIGNDQRVAVTIDLFSLGIIFLKKELTKQNFVIRY